MYCSHLFTGKQLFIYFPSSTPLTSMQSYVSLPPSLGTNYFIYLISPLPSFRFLTLPLSFLPFFTLLPCSSISHSFIFIFSSTSPSSFSLHPFSLLYFIPLLLHFTVTFPSSISPHQFFIFTFSCSSPFPFTLFLSCSSPCSSTSSHSFFPSFFALFLLFPLFFFIPLLSYSLAGFFQSFEASTQSMDDTLNTSQKIVHIRDIVIICSISILFYFILWLYLVSIFSLLL